MDKAHGGGVLLVAYFRPGSLELSFSESLKGLGVAVSHLDLGELRHRAMPVAARLGRFTRYLPIERWRSTTAKLALESTIECAPAAVIFFGRDSLDAGTIAQMLSCTGARAVLVWPDPLGNLCEPALSNLRIVDVVASYSNSSCEYLARLGARQVVWLPFAFDDSLHTQDVSIVKDENKTFGSPLSFIGNWRPERERDLSPLVPLGLKIWGVDWLSHLPSLSPLRKAYQGRPAIGDDFVRVVRNSQVNINLIDKGNYPAANMRLFELAGLGACQLATSCPEFEHLFIDGKHVRYADRDQLHSVACELLASADDRAAMGAAARLAVMGGHLYKNRARVLLNAIGVTEPIEGPFPTAQTLRPESR